MVALDTQLSDSRDGSSSKIIGLAEHPSTSGRLPTPDALLVDFQQRGDLRGADPFTDRYFVRSTGLAIYPHQVTPIQVAIHLQQPLNTGGNLRDRSAASFLVVRHTLRLATSNNRDRFHRPGFTGNACQVVPIHHSRRQDRIPSSSLEHCWHSRPSGGSVLVDK